MSCEQLGRAVVGPVVGLVVAVAVGRSHRVGVAVHHTRVLVGYAGSNCNHHSVMEEVLPFLRPRVRDSGGLKGSRASVGMQASVGLVGIDSGQRDEGRLLVRSHFRT